MSLLYSIVSFSLALTMLVQDNKATTAFADLNKRLHEAIAELNKANDDLRSKVDALTSELEKAHQVTDVLAQELDNTNQALESSRQEQANQLTTLTYLQEELDTFRQQRDSEMVTVVCTTNNGENKMTFPKNIETLNCSWVSGIPPEITQFHNLKTLVTSTVQVEKEFTHFAVTTLELSNVSKEPDQPFWNCFPNLAVLKLYTFSTINIEKLIGFLKQVPCNIRSLHINKNACDQLALLEYNCDKMGIELVVV